jgi:hypothetical protein
MPHAAGGLSQSELVRRRTDLMSIRALRGHFARANQR